MKKKASKKVIKTSTGIQLVLHENLTQYAKKLRLKNVLVFNANGMDYSELLVVENGKPGYAPQRFEDVAMYLDIMKFVAACNKKEKGAV